eukprot:gene3648-6464_t
MFRKSSMFRFFSQRRNFFKNVNFKKKITPVVSTTLLFGLFCLPFYQYYKTRKTFQEKYWTDKKVTLYIGTSIDGYIADNHGGISFLTDTSAIPEDYGYTIFMQNVDAVLLGGKTYRQILKITKDSKYPYEEKENYVYTTDKDFKEEGNMHKVEGDVEDLKNLIQKLKEEGKNIWLVGGSELNHKLEKAGLIDQYIITYLPVILGEGVPLFTKGPGEPSVVPLEYEKLRLISHEVYKTGAVQNTYVKEKLYKQE